LRLRFSILFMALAHLLLLGLSACSPDPEAEAADIFEAARAGSLLQVEAFLEAEPALLQATDGDGLTPLHHAVLGAQANLAEYLLDRGADISAVDAEDRTPLHHAANAGDPEAVALLLARGASVMAREFRGRTPLFIATNWGENLEVVEQLIAAGADVNDITPRGEEILFSSLFYGLPEVLDALLEAGARLPEDDERVVRAVFLSASNGYEGVFEMSAREAEARGLPWWEEVPMHSAARSGSVLIGRALLERDVALDEKNLYGITPLHIAAEKGHVAFVEFLAENGAAIEEPSVMGMTALHMARESGHDSVASALLNLGASEAPAAFPELTGPWLGQPDPGGSPERFALGIVSGHGFNSEHSPAAFSPDGTEAYWTKAFRGPISFSKLKDGRWTPPAPAPFLSDHGEGEPIFNPDGSRLYFMSQRPLGPGVEAGKENIWYVERDGDGWSEPSPVGPAINDFNLHWCFSLAESGTLYFHSVREGGYGRQDLYRSEQVDGVHQPAENLGPILNTEEAELTAFIAPDESYIIFSTGGHGLEGGMFHFVISYRQPAGGWSDPEPLDEWTQPVQGPLCPIITSDSEFMFFIGSGDIWWTKADFIEELRTR
jgi:ankyrin repeat protein